MTSTSSQYSNFISSQNTDPRELERFNRYAEDWWDPQGKFRAVHAFNGVRLSKIEEWVAEKFDRSVTSSKPFHDLSCVDIGCGGGLISEPLAKNGACVTGIDASERNVKVAQWHARKSKVNVKYRHGVIEDILETNEKFDIVLNLEVVEHVPDPNRLLSECVKLLNPNGVLIIATLNRTLRSFLLAIIGAEYVLRWLPRGTHQWPKFIRPNEIKRALSRSQLEFDELCGISYNPLRNTWAITKDTSVNYMILVQKSAVFADDANDKG